MSRLSSSRGWNQALRRRRFRKTQIEVVSIFCGLAGIVISGVLFGSMPEVMLYFVGLVTGLVVSYLILKIYGKLLPADDSLRKITWQSGTWSLIVMVVGSLTGLCGSVVVIAYMGL